MSDGIRLKERAGSVLVPLSETKPECRSIEEPAETVQQNKT